MVEKAPVAVIIASRRRPDFPPFVVRCLEKQTVLPHQVIISIVETSDLAPVASDKFDLATIMSSAGAANQRNTALRNVDPVVEFIIFLDDDFITSRFFIEGVVNAFERFEEAGGLGGRVLVDGALGSGLSLEEAAARVARADTEIGPPTTPTATASTGLYGCNMAFRARAIAGVRFDERLPLSAWLEDRDFSARIRGRLFKTDAFYGVHCGTKTGRERRGQRYGYSQVANPLYLARKGSVPPLSAVSLMLRVLAANHARVFYPDPWIDRRGRVEGNWIALLDLVRGRLAPERMIELG